MGLLARGIPVTGDAQFIIQGITRFFSTIANGDIIVPDLYLTDLASIPPLAQGVFMSADDPRIADAAVIHDWLYANKGKIAVCSPGNDTVISERELTREQCDKILCFEGMATLGASLMQQDTVFTALRLFGESHWNGG